MNNMRNGVEKFIMKNLHFPKSTIKDIHFLKGGLNQSAIQTSLKQHGYCLIRDTNLEYDLFNNNNSALITNNLQNCVFGSSSPNDNESGNKSMDYAHGTDQRPSYNNALLGVNDDISNTHHIGFHNELVYTNEFPKIIGFLCIVPSQTGGYTPLSDVRGVYNNLPKEMKDKFIKYGIKYVRNIRDRNAEEQIKNNVVDIKGQKCLQDLFHTNDLNEAESICRNVYKYDTEWVQCRTNDTSILRVTYNLPAVMQIECDTTAFVNSMLGMHGSVFDGYNHYYDSLPMMERPLHSLWGNGEEFTIEQVEIIKDLYEQNAIRFQWQAGDLIVADNLWFAHGRYPYTGDRKILALMGVPWTRDEGTFHVRPVHQ